MFCTDTDRASRLELPKVRIGHLNRTGVPENANAGLLPVLVRQTTELGDLFPTEEWGYFGEYSRIVGGVRLIQQRSKHEKASLAAFFKLVSRSG